MTSTDDLNAAVSAKLTMLGALGQIGTDEIHALTRKSAGSRLVSDALARIEMQTYGLCTECEKPITPKRLAALPWARYCMTCQEARDRSAPEARWNNAA
jgi:RNA polymerase-binding transcription factor DksA